MTDPHLNFVEPDDVVALGKRIAAKNVDALVITGDIGEADSVEECLETLQEALDRPIYFVLGNHDAYGSSISAVMARMGRYRGPKLRYLTREDGPLELTPGCALIGDDGWYDGRNGDLLNSRVLLADFTAITEIRDAVHQLHGHYALKRRLEVLGDAASERARPKIAAALAKYEKVIFVTHVAPFAQSATYRGKVSDHHWQPFFSCKCMGEMLLEEFEKHPSKKMLVLCGHSHGHGLYEPRPNVSVMTGGARYRHPAMNRVITIDADLTIDKPR